MRNERKLLVCDLDNTLYDWVGFFVPAFYAMVDEAGTILKCDRDKLLDELRAVHQLHQDSEHPFALLETETVQRVMQRVGKDESIRLLDPAFHAFNSTRARKLVLHEGVRETLEELDAAGIKLVAHTESKFHGVVHRLRKLELIDFFSRVYCRERSDVIHRPRSDAEWLAGFPAEKVVELSHQQRKPDPAVLLEICSVEGFHPSESAFIGDSVARDILMAKKANVFAIWAAYGARHDPAEHDQLVRVTHWSPDDIVREQSLREEASMVSPDFIAERDFSEVSLALLN